MILRDPNHQDPAGSIPTGEIVPPADPPTPPPASPAATIEESQVDPPPSAVTVLEGDVTEDSVKLKEKLTAAERAQRAAEIRAAELENENIELRKIPKPQPAPNKKSIWDEICSPE